MDNALAVFKGEKIMDAYIENSITLTEILDKIRQEMATYPIEGEKVDISMELAVSPTGNIVISNGAYTSSIHMNFTMGKMGINAHMEKLSLE